MGYRTLFDGSAIHHSNAGLQVTHDMYIADFFMLLLNLTPDHGTTGQTLHMDKCNIRIELKFNKPFPDAITCLL